MAMPGSGRQRCVRMGAPATRPRWRAAGGNSTMAEEGGRGVCWADLMEHPKQGLIKGFIRAY